ncbi:unnamed protein product [Camellia sinensis]
MLRRDTRVRCEHRFEDGAASSLWLLDGAAVGDVGEAVGHLEDQGGAVDGRRRSGGVRVEVSGVCNGEDANAEDGEEESGSRALQYLGLDGEKSSVGFNGWNDWI